MDNDLAPSQPRPAKPDGWWGLPPETFAGLWTVGDAARFMRVEQGKARRLLKAPGAPPRLRLGSERCDRWNPAQVVAWLHGEDWRHVTCARPDGEPTPAGFPGRPWRPSTPGRARR